MSNTNITAPNQTNFKKDSIPIIIDPTDLEHEIISHAQIRFRYALGFVLLYKQKDQTSYSLVGSTLATRDPASIELNSRVQAALRELTEKAGYETEPLSFDDFGEKMTRHVKPDSKELIINASHTPQPPVSQGESETVDAKIKVFRFNHLAAFSLNNGMYVMILGFYNGDPQKEEHLKEEIEAFKHVTEVACRQTLRQAKQEEQIPQWLKSLIERDDSTYAHLVQSYKRMLAAPGVDNVHLFEFNAHDRRLYYRYTDNINPDSEEVLKIYRKHCLERKGKWGLSQSQRDYVLKQFERLFSKGSDEKMTRKLLEEARVLLFHLTDPDWVTSYFMPPSPAADPSPSKFSPEEKRWLLSQLFSCIPQEPWTGVAGYTAQTHQIDISRPDKEPRWGRSSNRTKNVDLDLKTGKRENGKTGEALYDRHHCSG